jgi:hypothetical protein
VLDTKFTLPGYLLCHERVRRPAAKQMPANGRAPPNPCGAGRRNAARRRPEYGGREAGATNIWRNIKGGFLGLQPIEIPKNRQSFLWKSLEQNTLDLEKLGKTRADRHHFAISTTSAGEALLGGFPHL